MTQHDPFTLQRLRLWLQIETLLNELQDRLYDWYDNDPTLQDLYNRLYRISPHNQQLSLPFMTDFHPPNSVQEPCPLCQIKKWP